MVAALSFLPFRNTRRLIPALHSCFFHKVYLCWGTAREGTAGERSRRGGGGVTLPLLPALGPREGGGPGAGAVVTAFDPLMWGRSSRKDSYSLPEEGKQGG